MHSISKIPPSHVVFQNPSFLKSIHSFIIFSLSSLDDIEDRYFLEGQLGKGTFGEVRLCREIATGDMYAAKIIDLKQVHYRVLCLMMI